MDFLLWLFIFLRSGVVGMSKEKVILLLEADSEKLEKLDEVLEGCKVKALTCDKNNKYAFQVINGYISNFKTGGNL